MSNRNRLPNRRANTAFVFTCENHVYRASAGRFPDGRLAEIFLDAGKHGSALQVAGETAAILASLCLQHGVDAAIIRHAINGPLAVALDHFANLAEFQIGGAA